MKGEKKCGFASFCCGSGKMSYRCHLIHKTVARQRLCCSSGVGRGRATVISSGTYLERRICHAYAASEPTKGSVLGPTLPSSGNASLGGDCLQTFEVLALGSSRFDRRPDRLFWGRTKRPETDEKAPDSFHHSKPCCLMRAACDSDRASLAPLYPSICHRIFPESRSKEQQPP
jgi:hypothetical protein